MKCFVIMPFAQDFNDVYFSIQAAIKELSGEHQGLTCGRLDEIMGPGKITDDLVRELNQADVCIADLTGNNPNVMWEVGYAMALGKPVVSIAQSVSDLPFDLQAMRTIQYSRSALGESLAQPLSEAMDQTCNELTARRFKKSPAALEEGSGSEVDKLLADLMERQASGHRIDIIPARSRRDKEKIYASVREIIETTEKSLLCVTHHVGGPDHPGEHLEDYYGAIERKIQAIPDFEYRRVFQMVDEKAEVSATTIGDRGYDHYVHFNGIEDPGPKSVFFYRTALKIHASYLIADEKCLFLGIPHVDQDGSEIRTLICVKGSDSIIVRPFVEHFDELAQRATLLERSEGDFGISF
ncbi:MAG: nucleoside 2-deoxyribosyltransferase [Acidobacteriota bacterium]